MEISELAEIVRKEKTSSSFQELGESFYAEFRELVGRTFSSYPEYSKERENLKNLISDLISIREKKLLKNALSFARSGEEIELENLAESEKEAIKTIVEAFKTNRAELTKIIYSKEAPRTTAASKAPAPKEQKEEQALPAKAQEKPAVKEEKPALPQTQTKQQIKKITITMLSELPSILGSDGKPYGPFKKEDVVFLPEKNAKILIAQGHAVEIK